MAEAPRARRHRSGRDRCIRADLWFGRRFTDAYRSPGVASERGHLFCMVYAEGACPFERNRKYLNARNIKFITSLRSNARSGNKGFLDRGETARLRFGLPYDERNAVSGYGQVQIERAGHHRKHVGICVFNGNKKRESESSWPRRRRCDCPGPGGRATGTQHRLSRFV